MHMHMSYEYITKLVYSYMRILKKFISIYCIKIWQKNRIQKIFV